MDNSSSSTRVPLFQPAPQPPRYHDGPRGPKQLLLVPPAQTFASTQSVKKKKQGAATVAAGPHTLRDAWGMTDGQREPSDMDPWTE